MPYAVSDVVNVLELRNFYKVNIIYYFHILELSNFACHIVTLMLQQINDDLFVCFPD